MRGWGAFLAAGAAALLVSGGMAAADPLPRTGAAAGSVIARKAGEEARFIEIGDWQTVDLRQDLLAGDVLRTNAGGSLAILFSDRTQVRLGRNSTLVVRKVGGDGTDTELALESGQLWGRAARGGEGVAVATPAATAAIRGTDWSMQVGGDSTTLSVFEGRVELANPQGAVVVAQGEGARAAVGQAPRKYILVDPDEREQMLLYSDERGIFETLPASGLSGPETRKRRDRLAALPAASLSAEQRVALAESLLDTDGRAAALAALAPLRRPLASRPLEARALLLEAIVAGRAGRYAEAETLFARAERGLPPDRRGAAAYGRWFADTMQRPDEETPPASLRAFGGEPALALAALSATPDDGPAETLRKVKAAEKRFPRDARLPALAADLAMQLDRRDEVEAALARARAIDPDEPAYLVLDARYRANFFSDLDGARAQLLRAAAIAPGDDVVWNELGTVENDRNAVREADAAYRKAVLLDPESPVLHANYARFLLDWDQIKASKAEIDKAEALDPSSYAVLAVKGRYLLRIGRTEEGRAVLLQATAVDPTYGDALIGQAIAANQLGEIDEAAQAIDNVDRFDKENYAAPLIRSGIAIDEYRADEAIRNAREALRRRRGRGGFFSGLDANRQTGSYVGVALDLLELDEWGDFYGDRAFDPFLGSSYVDEAADGRVSPFAGTPALLAPDERSSSGSSTVASLLQATLLDPFSIASRRIRNSGERQAFNEAAAGGGVLFEDGVPGWRSDLTAQGQAYFPLPFAYSVQAEIARPEGPRENDAQDLQGATFTLGFKPTLADNLTVYGSTTDQDSGFPGQAQSPSDETSETRVSNLGVGWSHTFAERNVLEAFVSGTERRGDQDLPQAAAFFDPPADVDDCFGNVVAEPDGCLGPYSLDSTDRNRSVTAGVAHLFGVGPLSFRYGAEANWGRSTSDLFFANPNDLQVSYETDGEDRNRAMRAYGDALWRVTPDLTIEAGLWASRYELDPAPLVIGDPGLAGLLGDSERFPERLDFASFTSDTNLDGRVGLAWSPAANHYLRAYYREDTQFATNDTLAPISTVGLAPLDLPLALGGETRTLGLRWDAEWSERFFTSVEYQHLDVDGLAVDTPGFLTSSFTSSTGTIDRLELAANWWIGNGFGAFATVALNDSRDADYLDPIDDAGLTVEDGLPLIPDYLGRIGITYVSPYLFKATVAQTFVGRRVGGPYGIAIDPYTTTDASLTFLAADRHLEFEVQALNLFDEDFELALGVPGPGQTFSAVLRARF